MEREEASSNNIGKSWDVFRGEWRTRMIHYREVGSKALGWDVLEDLSVRQILSILEEAPPASHQLALEI
jgi:hypothetical protein